MLHDIFVSYAREDRPRVEKIAEYMAAQGVDVWFDRRITGGQEQYEEIANALRGSSFVLLVWSASAAGSAFVQKEINLAATLGKIIIPVRLDRHSYTPTASLILAGTQFVDARRERFPELELRKICSRIEPKPHKPAPVIATLNMKGGVGKTTLTANLAAAFHSEHSKSVLAIDLDPQANLSNLLVDSNRYEERVSCDQSVISCFEPSICTGALSPARDLRIVNPINGAPPEGTQLAFNLRDPLLAERFDVIIGQFELFKYSLPTNFPYLPACHDYFRRFIEIARNQYDLIFIDAAPSNSFITECAVVAATDIIAPVTPDKYALRGLAALKRLIGSAYQLPSPPRVHVLRNSVQRDVSDAEQPIINEYAAELLDARIPKSDFFATKNPNVNAVVRDTLSTLAYYRGHANIKQALRKTCREVLDRIDSKT